MKLTPPHSGDTTPCRMTGLTLHSHVRRCRLARAADERKHGLSTQQFPVSAYVGSSKNLKDVKESGYKAIWKREFKTPMAQGRSTKIITMIKWIRTIRLSIKNSPSKGPHFSSGKPYSHTMSIVVSPDTSRSATVHRRPFVGASQVRSWSRWCGLGAILWAFIAKN